MKKEKKIIMEHMIIIDQALRHYML